MKKESKLINIVYYTFINRNAQYKIIIEEQLDDIINSDIIIYITLHIVISCEFPDLVEEIQNIINTKLLNKNIDYNLNIESKNIFEYYGLKKIYDLAVIEPEKYYLYIHGKGMFNSWGDPNPRVKSNVALTRCHINPWKKIIDIFQNNKNIKIITMFPHEKWAWFNFWWASGNYLSTCEDPKICLDDRYYYESWLGTGHIDNNLSYNLHEDNYITYTAQEACKLLIDYIENNNI